MSGRTRYRVEVISLKGKPLDPGHDFISPVNEVVVVDEEGEWPWGSATYVMLGTSWLAMAWAEMRVRDGYTRAWRERHPEPGKREAQLVRLQVAEEMSMSRTVVWGGGA